ncbi:RNA-binding protein 5-like isoform X2 [Watersipora subatra]|uniref:RNA-binding protein 5-like isoform X2 n=1 Tax=Watersipora subatra TaxID=2589382 RepID=UPI00355BE606
MGSRRSPDYYSERDRDYRRDDGWQKEPACTVLIKNVPEEITERDLDRWFDDRGIRIRDIRLITKRSGSRGQSTFAFVEFDTVQESADWMNEQQGLMRLTDDHVSGLVYSRRIPRSSYNDSRSSRSSMPSGDWTCPNTICNFINFAKRSECFRCTTPKPSRSSKSAVIIRGLDGLTTEQSLLDALAAVTSLEPKNCYVMRNFSTGASLGYAFMEFDSAVNGKKVRDHFTNKHPLEVDGKLAMVDYAKNTYSTILASIQYQSMDQQQYDQYNQSYRKPTEYELQALAASSANQMGSLQKSAQESQYSAPATNGYANLPQYPEPDTSKYQWDAASGYYYDPTTGLYYDANSQYYYNMTTQEYMYWDGTAKTYIPVKTESQPAEQPKSPTVEKPEKDEKKHKAKSIAKEMEKWAKSQNKKSKSVAQTVAPTPPPTAVDTSKPTSADMAYDVLVGKRLAPTAPSQSSNANPELMPPPSMIAGMKRAAAPPSGLVASYGGDESDGEDDPADEMSHIDKQRLTCNLCERKFNSTAILEKHVQMSDLHKQNLAKLQANSQGQLTKQYRDRAKERRLKEGNSARAGGFLKPS